MDHVAEIEDAADDFRPRGIHDDIVGIHVVVNDLRAQAGNDRRSMFLESVDDAFDHGAVAGIGDVSQHGPCLGDLADVP